MTGMGISAFRLVTESILLLQIQNFLIFLQTSVLLLYFTERNEVSIFRALNFLKLPVSLTLFQALGVLDLLL